MLCVGDGLAECRIFFVFRVLQLIRVENFAAIEAFQIFGVIILRDHLRARMFAGGFGRFGHQVVASDI